MGLVLTGNHVRLESLERHHLDGLVAAAAVDPSLYRWTPLPQGREGMSAYVDTAIAWREAGTAEPFAIIRLSDGAVLGSTRFWNLERWAWPEGYPRHGRTAPDVGEIGHTWLTASAIRTPVNTEAKLLMLTYAFEGWEVLRICLHTDSRNSRSRAAIERLGAKFEGILRAHRLAADFEIRDSARYSIIAAEWPEIRLRLHEFVARGRHAG
jgi:RimJ/RimL family protein N-acetyltransferase